MYKMHVISEQLTALPSKPQAHMVKSLKKGDKFKKQDNAKEARIICDPSGT